MRTTQLLLFFLLVCQTTESLTDKRVNLGQSLTLDCPIDVKDIYWVFQKLTDSPVVILRTFTSGSTTAHLYDERFKDKYSSLTLSRLFIINITIDELGIYYCVKIGTTLQLSNGTRLYISEAARDQNQTEVNNISQSPKTLQALIVLYVILSIVMFLAIIVLLLWCQTTESLTDKRVNLGKNVTLDCPIDIKEIYWVFQKLPDSPVVILRTFTSGSTTAHLYDERFKDKYSSLTLSRLFIINITIDELGIYYCAKTGNTLQLSNGTRLYISEAARDQNQTEVNNNSKCPNTTQAPMILYFIPNIVMFLAIMGLLQIKLQVCKKRHQQCQDEELELYSTNDEEFSKVEFHLSHPTNNTFGKQPNIIKSESSHTV